MQWRVAGGRWATKTVKGLEHTVKGLKYGSAYEFRVRGVSGSAKGAWYSPSLRWLKAALKVKAAKGKKPGAIKVSWAKDAEASHRVCIYAKEGGKVIGYVDVAGGKSSVDITGLEAGRTYFVRVRPLYTASGATYAGLLSYNRKAKAGK